MADEEARYAVARLRDMKGLGPRTEILLRLEQMGLAPRRAGLDVPL